jgi:ubiquinone/menaquinone biosynthesis C-methylase UbiE
VSKKQNEQTNADQIEFWNGEAGEKWVARNAQMDNMLKPVSAALLATATPASGEHAIDIGCGCGNQTLMLAQAIGSTGSVTGLDISEPMLQHARRHIPLIIENELADIEYLQADASKTDLPENKFDLLVSRFGVMFFDQPEEAFAHLRKKLKSTGRLAFCCWQSPQNNEWINLPLSVVLKHVPPPEPVPDGAPGPFAFANPDRIRKILESAGFDKIKIEPLTLTLAVGSAPTLQESVEFIMEMGPTAKLLEGATASDKTNIQEELNDSLSCHYQDGALHLKAAIWLVQAGN